MAVHDIIPSSNVLASDIRDTLNANGSSCTNEMITFFNSKAVINHWSFRKPYATDLDMFKLTDAQIKSSDVNCGLKPYQIAAYTNLPSKMDGGMNGWIYERPTGGAASPYRLGDYVGYRPKALPMVHDFYVPSTASMTDSGVSATAFVRTTSGATSGSVGLADLGLLSNCYPAVFVRLSTNTSFYRAYVGGSKISSGTFNVDIPKECFTQTGVWEVYPFLCSSDVLSGGTYYTIANLNMRTITIKSRNFSVGLTATRDTSSQAIDYTITIVNSSSAVTWTNNTWQLRASGLSSMGSNLASSISVKANGTTTVTGTISNVRDDLWNAPLLELYISLNSGNETQTAVVPSMRE